MIDAKTFPQGRTLEQPFCKERPQGSPGDAPLTTAPQKELDAVLLFSHQAMSDSLQPHGLQPTRLCPWNSPGKNTRVGCYFLLQEILPTQGSNPGLRHCRQFLYHLSYPGSPFYRLAFLFFLSDLCIFEKRSMWLPGNVIRESVSWRNHLCK